MKSTIYNSFRVYNISNMTVFSLTSFLPVPDKPENVTILITPVHGANPASSAGRYVDLTSKHSLLCLVVLINNSVDI